MKKIEFLEEGLTFELVSGIKDVIFCGIGNHNDRVSIGRKFGLYGSKYTFSRYGDSRFKSWEVVKGWGNESKCIAIPTSSLESFLKKLQTREFQTEYLKNIIKKIKNKYKL